MSEEHVSALDFALARSRIKKGEGSLWDDFTVASAAAEVVRAAEEAESQ